MKRSRQRRSGALFKVLAVLITAVAILLAMSVFFKISRIDVAGAESYSAEEIIEASGIEVGENLFFVDRFGAASRIFVELPYIDSVTVTRQLPNHILITVSESKAAACVTYDGGLYAVNHNGKVISAVDESEAEGLIRVTGIEVAEPKPGAQLEADKADAGKLETLVALMQEMFGRSMLSDVQDIDLSDATNPAFTYLDRFTVRVGANENIGYKLGMLMSAVEQLSDYESGTIDLSVDDKRAYFSPN
jgi:cell division protein FtsQ